MQVSLLAGCGGNSSQLQGVACGALNAAHYEWEQAWGLGRIPWGAIQSQVCPGQGLGVVKRRQPKVNGFQGTAHESRFMSC